MWQVSGKDYTKINLEVNLIPTRHIYITRNIQSLYITSVKSGGLKDNDNYSCEAIGNIHIEVQAYLLD